MLGLEHICQLAGLVMIVGSLILIFKQKIYLDAHTKEVMYVELPKIGKLRTNAPVLAVIGLGMVLVIYPVHLAHTTYLTVEQDFESNLPLTVDAYAVSKQTTIGNDRHLIMLIPNLPDSDYQPHLVLHAGTLFWEESVDTEKARHGRIVLEKTVLKDIKEEATAQPITAPKPEGFK